MLVYCLILMFACEDLSTASNDTISPLQGGDPLRSLKEKVLKRVLANYTSSIPPTTSFYPEPIVGVYLNPVTILDLDESLQIFTFSGIMSLGWTDEAVAWDIQEFPGVAKMYFQPDEIWTPTISIPNGADRITNIGTYLPLLAYYTGQIYGTIGEVFKTTCDVDVTMYPFDTQKCTFGIIAWPGILKISNELSFNAFRSYFTGSTEWELINVTMIEEALESEMSNVTMLNVDFILKRRSIFYVTNVIFPMALLSYMNAFVFILPVESGEKVSYLVSIFVAESVFLNFINDVLPRSSSPPRMTYFLMILLCQSFLALMITMFVLKRHHHGTQAVGCFKKTNNVENFEEGVSVKSGSVREGQSHAKDTSTRKSDLILFFFSVLISSLAFTVFYI